MDTKDGAMEIATSDGYIFQNVLADDFVVRTTTSNQTLHLGISSNLKSALTIDNTGVKITSNLTVNNTLNVGTSSSFSMLNVGGGINITGNLYKNNNLMITDSNTVVGLFKVGAPIRQVFRPTTTTSNFTITVNGDYTADTPDADVYLNGVKLAYVNGTTKDYTLNVVRKGMTTDMMVYLTNNAISGDTVYVNIWPSLSNFFTDNTVYISSNVSPALEFVATFDSNNLYISQTIGIGTKTPSEALVVAAGNALMSNNAYIMKKVGIGKTNPNVALDITATDSIQLPKGTTAQRPAGPQVGYIRYNTDLSTFEGYGGANTWAPIGGVIDSNQDTYISAEMSNTNDDTIRFLNSNIERMRLTKAGNLGIGNNNPTYTLDVTGTAQIANGTTAGALYVTGGTAAGTGSRVFIQGGGSSGANVGIELQPYNPGVNNSSARILVTDSGSFGANFDIQTKTPGAMTNTLATRIRVLSTGNVGIGNTAPTELLHVSGKVYTTTQMLSTSNDSVILPSYSFKEDSNTGIYHASNQSLGFTLGGTEYIRMVAGGNVGIGTTAPTETLHVNGSARIASNLTVMGNLTISGDTFSVSSTTVNIVDNMIKINNGAVYNTSLQAGIEVNRGTGYDSYYFVFDETSGYFKVGKGVQLQTVATREDTPAATSTIPYYDATTFKYISSASFVYSGGNLGVGTAAPSGTIDVNGNVVIKSKTSPEVKIINSNNMQQCILGCASYNTQYSTSANSNDLVLRSDSSTSRVLLQSGVNAAALVVNSNNFVGIGTTTPNEKLHIDSGNIRVGNLGADVYVRSAGQFQLWGNETGSATFVHMIYSVGASTSTTGDHIWYTRGNTNSGIERMRISSVGNVGVGTSAPHQQARLHLSGGGLSNQLHFSATDQATNYKHWAMGTSGSNFNAYTWNDAYSASDIWIQALRSNETIKAVNFPTGYIGIGTTSPLYPLDVNGSAIVRGSLSVTNPTTYNAATKGWYIVGYWDCTAAQNAGAKAKISFIACNGYNGTSLYTGTQGGGETVLYMCNLNNSNISITNIDGIWKHEGGVTPITDFKLVQNSTVRYQYYVYANVQPFTEHSITAEVTKGTIFTPQFTPTTDPGVNSATVQLVPIATTLVGRNFGIGTSNPAGALHISGAGACNQLFLTSTTQATDAKNWAFGPNGNSFYGYTANDATSSTQNWIAVTRSANTVSSVNFPNGTIGIGSTTTPSYKVALTGTDSSASTGPHIVTYTTDTYPLLQALSYTHNNVSLNFDCYFDGTGWRSSTPVSYFQIYKLASNLNFNCGSGIAAGSTASGIMTAMSITSNALIGIGLTNPLSIMHIYATTPTLVLQNKDTGTANMQLRFLHNNATTLSEIGVNSQSNLFIANKQTGTLSFETNALTRMMILSGGNIGIGTITPAANLEVNGNLFLKSTTTPELRLVNASTSQQAIIACVVGNTQYSDSALINDLVVRADNSAARVLLQTGTAAAGVCINSNNYVGIGTTTPLETLHVNGSAIVKGNLACFPGTDSNLGIGLFANNQDGSSPAAFQGGIASWWGIGFKCNTDGVVRHMFDTRLGNYWALGSLGIGTSNPRVRAHIAGAGVDNQMQYSISDGATNTKHWAFGPSGSNFNAYTWNDAYTASNIWMQAIRSNEIIKAVNFPTGNIGIGSTSPPSFKCCITGDSSSGSNGPHIAAYVSTDTYPVSQMLNFSHNNIALNFDMYFDSTSSAWKSASTTGGFSIYKSSGLLQFKYIASGIAGGTLVATPTYEFATAMVIDGTGNIGMGGIVAPTSKLHVGGNIYATGTVTSQSDSNTKTNLLRIENAVDKLQNINGYTFQRIASLDLPLSVYDLERRHTGLIAQEVQNVLPEAVYSDSDNNLSIAYGNMAGILVEAIKELKQEIKDIKAHIGMV